MVSYEICDSVRFADHRCPQLYRFCAGGRLLDSLEQSDSSGKETSSAGADGSAERRVQRDRRCLAGPIAGHGAGHVVAPPFMPLVWNPLWVKRPIHAFPALLRRSRFGMGTSRRGLRQASTTAKKYRAPGRLGGGDGESRWKKRPNAQLPPRIASYS